MKNDVKKFDENGQELTIRFGLGAIKAVGIGSMSNLVEIRDQDGEFKDIYDFASRSGSKILNKKSVEALSKAGAFDNIHKNRHQIFESCEIICKYGASKSEERNSSQLSLFGAGSAIQIDNPALKDVKDWEKEERLQKEFEAFGYFVNEHPIDDYFSDLKKRGVISCDILNEEVVKDGATVILSGVVAYSKHRSGPKGRFAYLTLSDPIGIYETSIFSEELITNSRDLMESGSALVVICNVRKDEGGTRLLVNEILKIEDFIKNTSAKKEEFQNIKYRVKRDSNYNWKNHNASKDPAQDVMVIQMERDKRIAELKQKDIFHEITISIDQREAIFSIKSFLSQKTVSEELEKYTKVFLITGGKKIEIEGNYLIEKKDADHLNNINGLSVIETA